MHEQSVLNVPDKLRNVPGLSICHFIYGNLSFLNFNIIPRFGVMLFTAGAREQRIESRLFEISPPRLSEPHDHPPFRGFPPASCSVVLTHWRVLQALYPGRQHTFPHCWHTTSSHIGREIVSNHCGLRSREHHPLPSGRAARSAISRPPPPHTIAREIAAPSPWLRSPHPTQGAAGFCAQERARAHSAEELCGEQ